MTCSRAGPAVAPPDGADKAMIDFLKSMSRRTIHSASWTVITGPNHVTLDSQETLLWRTEGMGVKLDFSLDPETLQLSGGAVNIEITPNTVEFLKYFDLENPQIERRRGGYYDGFGTTVNNQNSTNIGTQVDYRVGANPIGNQVSSSQVANSPEVSNTFSPTPHLRVPQAPRNSLSNNTTAN